MDNPTYLGDGLYASFDGYQIRLYAHDGIRATDEVFLEPTVLAAFERFVATLREKVSQ
jgi:hypothetical protein